MGFQAAFGVHMRQPENGFTRFCKVKTSFSETKLAFKTFSGCLFAQPIGSLKTVSPQIRHPNRFLLRLALFFLAPAIHRIAGIARAGVGIIAQCVARARFRVAMASIRAVAQCAAGVRFYMGAIARIGRAQVARIAAAHIQAARIAGHAIAALVIRHAVYTVYRLGGAVCRAGRRLGWGAIMRIGITAMRQAQAQQTAA